MNILVTGGAGFIASHIVDALVEIGHHVSVIDNLSTGTRQNLNQNARFFEADITNTSLESIFNQIRPEIIIHHAAQIDVQTSIRKPSLDAQINIVGTLRLLEQCAVHGVRKFLYASSAAVYGIPQTDRIAESHPVEPISGYGISKETPERYLKIYAELYGLDYTILRYANVYGIRQDPKGEGGVVSIFVDHLLAGKTPVIFGDGEQTRDFIYVKDVAAANIAALTKGSRKTLNISSNHPTTVNELLELLCKQLQEPFCPVYGPSRSGDIRHSRLDHASAVKELGWRPQYGLEQGLMETLEYYRDRRKFA